MKSLVLRQRNRRKDKAERREKLPASATSLAGEVKEVFASVWLTEMKNIHLESNTMEKMGHSSL